MQITQEVIEALAWLRTSWDGDNSEHAVEAFNVLDNAGVFKEIDDHTGYDIRPDAFLPIGDPSEWGDQVAKVNQTADGYRLAVVCTQHGEIFRDRDTFDNRTNAHLLKHKHTAEHVDRAGRKGREPSGISTQSARDGKIYS